MDERERQAELREARAKAELDRNSELEVARKQGKAIGLEEGKAIGLEEGKAIGLEEGRIIGLEKGRIIGREQNEVQTISHMKAQGLDAQTISKLTGYSIESVIKVFEGK